MRAVDWIPGGKLLFHVAFCVFALWQQFSQHQCCFYTKLVLLQDFHQYVCAAAALRGNYCGEIHGGIFIIYILTDWMPTLVAQLTRPVVCSGPGELTNQTTLGFLEVEVGGGGLRRTFLDTFLEYEPLKISCHECAVSPVKVH